MHRARRTATPVRVALIPHQGGDIDGAWWPRSASIARELPDLIQALHPILGEIVDIDVNWSANSPTPYLSTMSPELAGRFGAAKPRHRLMFVTSRCILTKLLVVPSMTSAPLAMMLLRQAAERGIPEAERTTKEFQAAERVLRAARSESSAWSAERAGGPGAPL